MNKRKFHTMVAQYGTKTVTGMDSIKWSGGVKSCYLPSLKFYGGCQQAGTPAPDSPIDIYCNANTYVSDANGKYFYPPDLRGLGVYKDEWDYVSGKGLRYVHKIELDGKSENGKITSYKYNDTTRIALYTPQLPGISKSGPQYVLSTHFNPKWVAEHGNIYANNGGINIAFNNELFPNNQSIYDWLNTEKEAGTPVTIYYVLAEPIPFEERHEWDVYEPISNESGAVLWGDGNISGIPVEVTYITHS